MVVSFGILLILCYTSVYCMLGFAICGGTLSGLVLPKKKKGSSEKPARNELPEEDSKDRSSKSRIHSMNTNGVEYVETLSARHSLGT